MDSVITAHKNFMKTRGADSAKLNAIRQNGIREFAATGLPTSKNEDWKFSNLKKLEEYILRYCNPEGHSSKSITEIKRFLATQNVGKQALVFLNGKLIPELSEVGPLRQYAVKEGDVENTSAKDAIKSLNSAFLISPIEITIKTGANLSEPIWIINLSSEGCFSNTSTKINAGENCSVEIVEAFFSLDNKPGLSNAATEIFVNQCAQVNYFVFQELGEQDGVLHNVMFQLGRDAKLLALNWADSFAWSRNLVTVVLNGSGAQASLFGLNLPAAEQFVDHCLKVVHAATQTTSKQLYKGVLSGKSKSIFNGKIIVNKGSMGAVAEQLNKNIICDKGAEAITRPQLEVNNDDVRATHGATIGKINLEELFYLESRGLSKDVARRLLTEGFVREVLELGLSAELKVWALNKLNIGELVGKDVV